MPEIVVMRDNTGKLAGLGAKNHANSSPDGIHGQRRAWKLAGVGEMDALADTIEQLSKGRR